MAPTKDMDMVWNRVREMLDVNRVWSSFPSIILHFIAAHYVLISCNQRQPGSLPVGFGLAAVPFVPLYIIAIDWGRWIGLHVFSATNPFLDVAGDWQSDFRFPDTTLQFLRDDKLWVSCCRRDMCGHPDDHPVTSEPTFRLGRETFIRLDNPC